MTIDVRRELRVPGQLVDLHRAFTGPNLDQLAGFVTPTGAYDEAKQKIGLLAIDKSGGATLDSPLVFCQRAARTDRHRLISDIVIAVALLIRRRYLGWWESERGW